MTQYVNHTASEPENSKEGYHQFVRDVVMAEVAHEQEYGSFKVWLGGEGWYWWACYPGCIPDGEPVGPFNTSTEAYNDARSS